jgi:CubicO group peptidase (beta-lactamase class C family)
MQSLVLTLSLLTPLAPTPTLQEAESAVIPFPPSTALAEGVSPEALDNLDELVRSLVEEGEIVGAELLVIKNGKSILHEGYGWRNRETEVPMEPNGVFCVRSMTKPFIGASIMMLVEEKKIKLSDPIAKYLPAFDVEDKRGITIEHLITHTSGLTMSKIASTDLSTIKDIHMVSDLGGASELEFEPGTSFNYSDQGTDTLTALVEVVSGITAEAFVTTRLLQPLGMDDSTCIMEEGNQLRARGCAKYGGSSGQWIQFWNPEKPPLFPTFLGSQGLYSTTTDYARFLDFWMRKGRVGKERLLKSRSVRSVLKEGAHKMSASTALPGLEASYGSLMQLWTGENEKDPEGERDVVAFGHTGSDGTHGWAFPKQKAMVLYFTQSRGTTTGFRVEELLGDLLLGVPYNPNQAAPPLEEYLGYYWEGENDKYRSIIRDGDDLALEIGGTAVIALDYTGEDRWKFRMNPGRVIEFDRNEAGEVTGYHMGDHQEFRFVPSPDLPSIEELAEQVRLAHRIDLLETLGPLRMHSKLTIEKQGIDGTIDTLLAWPNSIRADSEASGQTESVSYDGETVRYQSTGTELTTLEGDRADQVIYGSPFYYYDNWLTRSPKPTVIQRVTRGERVALLVRMGDTSAAADTLVVDAETGHVVGSDTVVYLPMLGRIGQKSRSGEFREVHGMTIPFRTAVEYPNPMIGTIVVEIQETTIVTDLEEGAFYLN